ncbi:RNA-splicing factor [Rhizophlyctis rosea]|uniref:RNA-splicing factor n=1 Tax=Rhizophlyctis rosea TaxID=64517 RepID=A0AAD5SH24_9FUNG|nr:RNA-splicing factor [Rhizophlyctis rosea]
MYNGIGLSTARGSGTNGYVQRNLSAFRPRDKQSHQHSNFNADDHAPPSLLRKPNQDILLHERKRQVEVKCLELQENLESAGDMTEEEIEARVDSLRQQLTADLHKMTQNEKTLKDHQVHQLAEAKEKKNAEMQQAFGISSKNFVEGAAFDRDLQERLKQERAEKRQQQEDERIKRILDDAERRKKEAKEREKEAKKWEEERERPEEERRRLHEQQQQQQMAWRQRQEQQRRDGGRRFPDHYDGRGGDRYEPGRDRRDDRDGFGGRDDRGRRGSEDRRDRNRRGSKTEVTIQVTFEVAIQIQVEVRIEVQIAWTC